VVMRRRDQGSVVVREGGGADVTYQVLASFV